MMKNVRLWLNKREGEYGKMRFVLYVTEFLLRLLDFDIIYVAGYGISRKDKTYWGIFLPIIIIVNYILTVCGIGAAGELITYFLSICVITALLYHVGIKQGVMVVTIGFSIVVLVEAVIAEPVRTLLRTAGNYNEDLMALLIFVCVTLFFVLCIKRIMQRMQGAFNYMKLSHGLYYFFIMAVNIYAMLSLNKMIDSADISETEKQKFLVAFVLLGIGTLVQVAILAYLTGYRSLYQEKELLVKEYFGQQEQHYRYLKKKEIEVRKYQHDIRSHLAMFQLMLERGDLPKLKNYLGQICGKLNEIESDIRTGNGVLDAILNYYQSSCIEKGIHFSVNVRFPKQAQMEDYDICTLFSNLLKNAVEAAEGSGEREISLDIRDDGKAVHIVLSNSFRQKPVTDKDTGKWLSAKRGYQGHGYGMMQIQECVEKYHGSVYYDTDSGKCSVMVVLYLGREEKGSYAD